MELAHYDWNELRARMHSSKEEEVIRSLQYLFSGQADQVKFNLNQNNAKVVSEWVSKYGYSSEIVKTYQNGTVDIVISRSSKKSQLTELDQFISSLSSSISVKESVRSELSGLLTGRKASIVLNLNQLNAEKVKDFAESVGLKVEILRSYNNGTVDILLSKKDRSQGSVPVPWFKGTQDNGKINGNYSYYMNAEIVGFRILQELRTNQKFKDFFEQLDDFERRLFVGYAIGCAFLGRSDFGPDDYELRTSRSQRHFTSYIKTNLNALMENFERRLKQAVSRADQFINLLDQKFKQQNITLKGQLGPEYEKFRRGLIVMFMEFEIKDITTLANIDINRFLSWSNQLNRYRGKRHSPANSVDLYEIKHSVLSSLILGKMFGVDPRFYLIIAAQESNFNNSAVGESGTGLGQQTANGSILTNYRIDYKSNYGNYISPVTTRAMMFEVDSGSNGSIFISFYEMAKLIQEKKGYLDISRYKQSNIRQVAERYNGHPDNQIQYGTSVARSYLWKILE